MGQLNTITYLALLAFPLFAVACFARLQPARAVLVTTFVGWLFLPHIDSRLDFLRLHTKGMITGVVILLVALAFDGRRWRQFRAHPLDLPVALTCITPFLTSIENGLGAKEGLAFAFYAALTWGVPYLLGRIYLGNRRGLDDLALAMVIATLAYVPLCLWEIRMSPHLHNWVYGFRPWSFEQSIRLGGYRPSVFMQHGLAVGMLMAVGTLVGYWLWRTGAVERLGKVKFAWIVGVMGFTTILGKSTGALALLAVGVAVLEGTRRLKTPVLVVVLALLPAAYCTARIAGWDAEPVVTFIREKIEVDRADSFKARIDSERQMIGKAMNQPWFGWGRFGRAFVYSDDMESLTVPDSLWIIAFGFTGFVGLVAVGALLALPPLALLKVLPARHWADPRLAPAAALAVSLLLWAVDDIVNFMMAPVFPMMAGALTSLFVTLRDRNRSSTSAVRNSVTRLRQRRATGD
jgi:hypothetical protein